MSIYTDKLIKNKKVLVDMAKDVLQKSKNRLTFYLQGQNLLQNVNNCIESSTAIGYAIEEFIVVQLASYSGTLPNPLKIKRSSGATTKDSFDCFFNSDGVKYLVNIKAEKEGSANDAIAAIKQLRKDYCDTDIASEKSYIILKMLYKVADADTSDPLSQRCIEIVNVESYSLEEIDIKGEKGGFQQDNRNWKGGASNYNNGRLKASPAFRRKHKMCTDEISYEHTRQAIIDIFAYNEKRGKK